MSPYGEDGYLKRRAVPVVERAALEKLKTRQLLGRLERLRRCIDSLTTTEYDAADAELVNGIVFKNTPEWEQAYRDVKSILDTRQHIPGSRSGPRPPNKGLLESAGLKRLAGQSPKPLARMWCQQTA